MTNISVNSYNSEFGYELIVAVPYAYYLHENGLLNKTISGKLSEPLYYFSPNHEINSEKRSWNNTKKLIGSGMPNSRVHIPKLDMSQFSPPPYKEHFTNDKYKWDKPTICICNKHAIEWGKSPINYFSLEVLKEMFNTLKDDYQIIYVGVDIAGEIKDKDNDDFLHLGDIDLCETYDVILFQDLLKESDLTWNELIMSIFANTDKFITINGGYSVLASYFGGTNIIYCKTGSEVSPSVNSFKNWYHEFGGSNIILTRTHHQLISEVKNNYAI